MPNELRKTTAKAESKPWQGKKAAWVPNDHVEVNVDFNPEPEDEDDEFEILDEDLPLCMLGMNSLPDAYPSSGRSRSARSL